MISIVTAYFNRKALFVKTLHSISQSLCEEEFEVIAVDDGSDEEERLEDLVPDYPFLKIVRIEKNEKWYNNSCIPFNEGFRKASGDKIIIQNPECYHLGDVLKDVSQNLNDSSYLSYACFSLDKKTTDDALISYDSNLINHLIRNVKPNFRPKNGDLIWYNHSTHRPEAFHFCSAITKSNLDRLGGFDDMFALGIAFDDVEFVGRVRNLLPIKFIDDTVVLHQNHYRENSKSYDKRRFNIMLYELNMVLWKNYFTGIPTANKAFFNKSLREKKYVAYRKILPKVIFAKVTYQILLRKILRHVS